MARAVNQTIAWLSSVFISALIFAAGYGVFSMMAGGSDHDSGGPGAKDAHGKSEHVEAGHGEAASGHGGHDPAKADAHATSDHGKTGAHSPAEKPADEHPASKAGAHGDDEEISADQFKKDEHH